MRLNIKKLLGKNSVLYFLLLAGIFIILSLMNPRAFLSSYNLQSMAFQVPEFGIFALGMMVTIITGGIDLSIIANSNLSAVFASLVLYKYMASSGEVMNSTLAVAIIAVICAMSGFLLGLFNGFLISFFRIPAILATLGTMKLYDGLSTVFTNGQALRNYPEVVAKIANNTFLGIPISFYLFVIAIIAMWIVMGKTKLGHAIYLYGVSPVVSRYSGLNNNMTILKTYCISGLMAGIAGLIMMSRFNSIKVGYGNAYQLLAVLVAIMGGVNPNGGKGEILCVTFSVMTLQCISSGFNILGFSNYVRNIIYGTVLIIVMVVNFLYPILKSRWQFRNKRHPYTCS